MNGSVMKVVYYEQVCYERGLFRTVCYEEQLCYERVC